MSQKRERQQVIQELVATRSVGSQEELRQLLAERGWEVTQSTLSRDMHDLRVARVPTPGGVRYTAADSPRWRRNAARRSRPWCRSCSSAWTSCASSSSCSTVVAGAQPISEAIDSEGRPDVIGTIAGENTILIICRSEAARERVAKRLLTLARRLGRAGSTCRRIFM